MNIEECISVKNIKADLDQEEQIKASKEKQSSPLGSRHSSSHTSQSKGSRYSAHCSACTPIPHAEELHAVQLRALNVLWPAALIAHSQPTMGAHHCAAVNIWESVQCKSIHCSFEASALLCAVAYGLEIRRR